MGGRSKGYDQINSVWALRRGCVRMLGVTCSWENCGLLVVPAGAVQRRVTVHPSHWEGELASSRSYSFTIYYIKSDSMSLLLLFLPLSCIDSFSNYSMSFK